MPGNWRLPIDNHRMQLWLQLLNMTNRIEAELRTRLRKEFRTTLPRFDVIAVLARNPGGLKMTALSEQLLFLNGNATHIVEKLVADGLVRRSAAGRDKREVIVKLTSDGIREFTAIAPKHEDWIETLLLSLDDRDVATLSSLLTKTVMPA